MKFGRFANDSKTPSSGYRVTQFAEPGFKGHIAKQTMISSQATYEVAKQIDPGLNSTQFEVKPDGIKRIYDIKNQTVDSYTEVKAGKSINPRQLAKDISLAKTGQAVEYVFTGNPLTGNHGPDAKTTAKLADAVQQSGGNFSFRVADDIAPPASKLTQLFLLENLVVSQEEQEKF